LAKLKKDVAPPCLSSEKIVWRGVRVRWHCVWFSNLVSRSFPVLV
jgi:hypothetical protein